ncbi:MAG: peptide chain release factor N(5)-glutamine methyltransferase [Bacteroidetes bacterium]|nr:peptide chain release factor N(5)-glutamine methyltransferase [Bacteroidota bacterium]
MPDEQTRVWTIRELMKSAIEHLQGKGFEEARLNVELLLAHALDIQRIQLYSNFDKPLTPEELKQFRTLYERRLTREPVQYIIGSANFMGLHFTVDPRVLIPRPETETLIEQVMLACHQYAPDQLVRILEVGTGSGNISISIAKFVKNTRITAIDISLEALAVAKQNARLHSVESRINFSCADIFDLPDELMQSKFDLLVSNPPYVPKDEWEQLQKEVRDFEPSSALTDGNDGFKFYNHMADMSPVLLKPGGNIVFEVGLGQAETVINKLKKAGLVKVQVTNDLQGIPRVVSGIWPGQQENLIGLN